MIKDRHKEIYPYKILVIDDHRSQLKLIKNRLSRYGCHVVTADSAEEAVQMMQWGERYEIIITDIKMPWLNGMQFCRRVKANYPEILVFALSGNISEYGKDELESSGFDGIYEKPISDELLVQILENMRP